MKLVRKVVDQNSENGDVEDENFSLQDLYNFVQKMLNTSEETKRTLQMECEEARFALKPWPIETTIVKEVDINTCTCEDNLTSGARAEEIAAEIGQTLLHSQQLREKLAANLHKERQNARKPDVREIYGSKPPAKEQQNPRVRRSASQQRQPEPRKNSGSAQRYRSVSTVRSRDGDERPAGRRSSITAKILQEPSKDNAMYRKPGQKGRQTNFVLANKLSVKTAKQLEEVAVTPRESRRAVFSARQVVSDKSTSTRSDEVETLSELDRLIKKFDVASISSSRSTCPVHSENASGTIEQKVVTLVDAVEGLDRFGVPSSLIKILKTYHAYIKAEVFNEMSAITKKQQEAANNFLNNFNKLAKKKRTPDISNCQDLLCGYSSLCKDSFKPHMSDRQFKFSKSTFIALEPLYSKCDVKNIAAELKFVRTHSDESYNQLSFDMKNWISNGIWNYFCIPDLKDLFGTHCIRYSDRSQLIQFYGLIQRVQRKSYEAELIELIMLTVIPKLKELFEPDSKEFIDTYKMIAAVTQIINPKVPVLAKSENEDEKEDDE